MSQIVLSNLDCSQAEEQLSEVLNADDVIGGFDFSFGLKISNSSTTVNTTVQNVLNIEKDLPSLQTINQVAGVSG